MTETHQRERTDARPRGGSLTINPKYGRRRGHTLIELTVVMFVMALLASFGVPQFVHSLEQSKVDMAATNLRAIWTAQRLYWLAHQTYAPDLNSLYSDPTDQENFLAQPDPVAPTQPYYQCAVTPNTATATDFQATATRSPSSSWSGTLSIGSNGVVTGSVTDPGGYIYYPTPSFQ